MKLCKKYQKILMKKEKKAKKDLEIQESFVINYYKHLKEWITRAMKQGENSVIFYIPELISEENSPVFKEFVNKKNFAIKRQEYCEKLNHESKFSGFEFYLSPDASHAWERNSVFWKLKEN